MKPCLLLLSLACAVFCAAHGKEVQVPRRLLTGGLRSLHAAGSDWEEMLTDCTLPLLGATGNTTFDSCVAVTDSLHVMWSLLPGENGAPDQMLWGLAGATDGQGYVAVGFPSEPGMMVGASAFILSNCDDCDAGVTIGGYYLGGRSAYNVAPPSKIEATELEAASDTGSNWLFGSFKVDASAVTSFTSLIYAAGPATSSGGPEFHNSRGEFDVEL